MQEEGNTIKHRVTAEELKDSFHRYLGEKNREALSQMKLKMKETFDKLLPLDKPIEGAYFVKGTQSALLKFKAYFVSRCFKKRYEYATFMLKEYVEGLTENNDNELFVSGREKEVLFLYLHGSTSGSGGTNNWIASTTIDKTVNRKRKGQTTVILSEKNFPLIEDSKEIRVIDLGGAQVAEVIQNVNLTKAPDSTGNVGPCY